MRHSAQYYYSKCANLWASKKGSLPAKSDGLPYIGNRLRRIDGTSSRPPKLRRRHVSREQDRVGRNSLDPSDDWDVGSRRSASAAGSEFNKEGDADQNEI